jgi:predicted nucleotidyltransferase
MKDPVRCLEKPPLAKHLPQVRALCREYGVSRLEVFGSFCTAEFDALQSDIDVLVELPPDHDLGPWPRDLSALQDGTRELLGRAVDLVLSTALRNRWFRQEAAKTRTLIYDASPAVEVAWRHSRRLRRYRGDHPD